MTTTATTTSPIATSPLTPAQRYLILAASFLGWMFAGLQISLFPLINRPAMLNLLPSGSTENDVMKWFAWYQAAFMFGAAAGGWVFGWLGDRVGRARSLGLSVVWYSAMTGLSFFAKTPEQLLVLRTLCGLGVGGVWPNAVSLTAEAWPDASRPLLAGLLGTAANFGFVLLGLIAYFYFVTPTSWRWTLLVGGSPTLLGILSLLIVPESPKWKQSRFAAARQGGASTTTTRTTSTPAPRAVSPISEILRPPLLRRTLIGIALGSIPVIGTAANANWLVPWSDHATEQAAKSSGTTVKKPDPRLKALTQIERSGGAVFGSLLGGWLASLLGRRVTYFLISLGALIASTIIFAFLNPLAPGFSLATFALGFVGVTYFGWLPLYLPELYPTRVRSTGTGVCFNSGRVFAAAATLGATWLIARFHGDYGKVGLWTGMIYAVGMLIILFAPSTGGKKLED